MCLSPHGLSRTFSFTLDWQAADWIEAPSSVTSAEPGCACTQGPARLALEGAEMSSPSLTHAPPWGDGQPYQPPLFASNSAPTGLYPPPTTAFTTTLETPL
uniref:Uncharacterized protein n=1 Tax=Eutreptiella gymnastica TaxID=73025 RepID=A0A6T2GQC4_9EUGL|mmetsp:Transcript_65758/g.109655  ORF Transcript_65758/g.109655 Transcript_65758/m.109655 type:complete len:101 (-) Transcript_65758:303-605(-)